MRTTNPGAARLAVDAGARRTTAVLLAMTLLLHACTATARPRALEHTLAAVDTRLREMLDEHEIPSIAVAIVLDGEVVLERGYGWANKEARVPATEHTPYCIASVSKTLTVTGLMALVERGSIDLDRPINDYLGPDALRSVAGDPLEATVRHVTNHTSGLMKYVRWVDASHLQDVVPVAEIVNRYGVLVRKPGEHYVYSNLGYGALERVIERVSGQSFVTFMRDSVFVPLGMTRTSVGVNPQLAHEAAVKYKAANGARFDYVVLPYSSGEIYSSAHDLARFALFQLKHPLEDNREGLPLSHDGIDTLHRPTFWTAPHVGKAMAWATLTVDDHNWVVEHDGGGIGMRAEVQLYPQEDLAIVALTNTDTRAFQEIRRTILNALRPGLSERFEARYAITHAPALEVSTAPDAESAPTLVSALAGTSWRGQIEAPEGSTSVLVKFNPSGDVYVSLDNKPWAVLSSLRTTTTQVNGWFLGLPDERFEWRRVPFWAKLDVSLEDVVLRGSVETSQIYWDWSSHPGHTAISLWTELTRVEEEGSG